MNTPWSPAISDSDSRPLYDDFAAGFLEKLDAAAIQKLSCSDRVTKAFLQDIYSRNDDPAKYLVLIIKNDICEVRMNLGKYGQAHTWRFVQKSKYDAKDPKKKASFKKFGWFSRTQSNETTVILEPSEVFKTTFAQLQSLSHLFSARLVCVLIYASVLSDQRMKRAIYKNAVNLRYGHIEIVGPDTSSGELLKFLNNSGVVPVSLSAPIKLANGNLTSQKIANIKNMDIRLTASALRSLTQIGYNTRVLVKEKVTVDDLNILIGNLMTYSQHAATLELRMTNFKYENMEKLFEGVQHVFSEFSETDDAFQKLTLMDRMLMLSTDGVLVQNPFSGSSTVMLTPNTKHSKNGHCLYFHKWGRYYQSKLPGIQEQQAEDYQRQLEVSDDLETLDSISKNIDEWLKTIVNGKTIQSKLDKEEKDHLDRFKTANNIAKAMLEAEVAWLQRQIDHVAFMFSIHHGEEEREKFGTFIMS